MIAYLRDDEGEGCKEGESVMNREELLISHTYSRTSTVPSSARTFARLRRARSTMAKPLRRPLTFFKLLQVIVKTLFIVDS
jgi:hypothetical protein